MASEKIRLTSLSVTLSAPFAAVKDASAAMIARRKKHLAL
jgi:hypothetical protein